MSHITTDSIVYFTNDFFFVLENFASRYVSFGVTKETVLKGDDTKPRHYMQSRERTRGNVLFRLVQTTFCLDSLLRLLAQLSPRNVPC